DRNDRAFPHPLAALPLALAGCGSSTHAAPSLPVHGPPHTLRIAVAQVRWPIDPAGRMSRDDELLVRTLLATPLRVDPQSGDVEPGLCTTWQSSDARTWTFRCREARAIARVLTRHTSWMFQGA